MKQEKKQLLPVDIKLPECVLLEGGVMFVTLHTLDELERFWIEHKNQFKFACEGSGMEDTPCFLREYEWVFGNSKSAIARTVMRWGKSGIGCEFYDSSEANPGGHEFFFKDREVYRTFQIEKGDWSDKDEAEHLAECACRSPETYRGWWRFCNLPHGYNPSEWFNPCIDYEELIDPDMPLVEVADKLHEQTFDDWAHSDCWEVKAHDRTSIDETIRYWRNEQAVGAGYYGEENEVTNA